MPYIKKDQRKVIDPFIKELAKEITLDDKKFLSYVFHDIVVRMFELPFESLSRYYYACYESKRDRIEALVDAASKIPSFKEDVAGITNYSLSTLIDLILASGMKYKKANCIIGALTAAIIDLGGNEPSNHVDELGVLQCVLQEFYRRPVAAYENTKVKESGEVYNNIYEKH